MDYDVIGTIDLACWSDDYETSRQWLMQRLQELHRVSYAPDQRIVIQHQSDIYVKGDSIGLKLRLLQVLLNELDITSSFVLVRSTNPNIGMEMADISAINQDPDNQIQYQMIPGHWTHDTLSKHPASRSEQYQYGSVNPIHIRLQDLDDRKKFLLSESKTFCMYPWVHLHAYPTGDAWPCCHAEMKVGAIGSVKTHTLDQLANSEAMRQLRRDMLAEQPNDYCVRCYEQEQAGFFGGRQSANKHHGHHIHKIDFTRSDGSLSQFQMTYWDIRFSNLCNLRCRSCGHIFSSSWYADQKQLAGSGWNGQSAMFYAGRTETDMWEQLLPHLDYVEQIYFAGGEPLMMDEHYRILDELERRGRFDVRLIYNTNFTQVKLKNRYVFDYWRRFKSVAVGASLDAMGPRAEYIRKGTDWSVVVANRRKMLEICPEVDFYISPTLSIMNALHLPDFHRDWVEAGLLKPQDLNVNVLQDPVHYRVDIAPVDLKRQIREKIQGHLAWLRPLDQLNRATQGFESALNFMDATDNSHLIPVFWQKTQQLDDIRQETLLDIIPELAILR
jgi:sulfatase maturation enzyme AslB (radical SAM superfamily)